MTWPRLPLFAANPAARGVLRRSAPAAAATGFVAAALSFLAVLALGLAFATGRLAASWQGDLSAIATLQIVASEDQMEGQARAALDVLRTTAGVRSVRMLDLTEQERLLAPWLGPDVPIESLPLPLMVEVEIDRDSLDAEALVARLAAEAPAAVYDDHSAWREPLAATASWVRLFALASLGLLALTLAAAAGIAARASVAANAAAIATLRLVGARDGLLRGALARPVAGAALAGGAVGTMLGAALLALVPSGSEQGFFLAGIGLSGWHWLAPLLVPPAAAATALAGAALAAERGLRRWT